jgi:hypothetical protein
VGVYELGVMLHGAVGTVTLAAFWAAALARKGGAVHRRAGQVYLASLLAVMTLASLMVAGKALEGDPKLALFLVFLISLVGTASWLTWFSVRRRRQPERITDGTYRFLATWLMAAGVAFFCLGVSRRAPLTMFLSLLGVGFGANMWRLALAPTRDSRWWLAHHMNGAMLNFIATHDSFLAIGVGSVVPELRQPVPRMMVAVSLTAIAVLVRAWKSRRPVAWPPAAVEPARTPVRS